MNDPSNIPGGLGGMLAAGGAMVVSAVLWLRRQLSRESVDRSADVAYRELIENLRTQITLERARNTDLVAARDAAMEQIDALRKQISELSEQVSKLQREIEAMGKP